jgi:hypothetical protein
LAPFALGINLAESAPLAVAHKKMWPITALELPDINKPQARISGVGISIPLQYVQTPAIEVTSVRWYYDLDSCQIEFKNNLVLGSHYTSLHVCMEGAVDTGCSDEHTPLSEIVVNFKGQRSLVRLAE